MNPLDQFVKREMRCAACLRYVDDMAVFSRSKQELWAWKQAIVERLQGLRLTMHEEAVQAAPATAGIPWLGFVVYPGHRRLKASKAVEATRRLGERFEAWQAGRNSFRGVRRERAGLDQSGTVCGYMGLREEVPRRSVWGADACPRSGSG